MSRPEYKFDQAVVIDAVSIAEATKYYYNRFTCKCGFLAGFRTAELVLSKLDSYYVVRLEGSYIGHVQISFGLPPEFEELDWYDRKDYDRLKNIEKVIYIEHIVIRSEFTGKGAGKFLLGELFQQYRDYLFLSSVIVKPYDNEYSLGFHKKIGFREVAYYRNDRIGDITFQSVYLLADSVKLRSEVS